MGEAAEKSEFEKVNLELLKQVKVRFKPEIAPGLKGFPVDAMITGSPGAIPKDAQEVKVTPAFAPDSKELEVKINDLPKPELDPTPNFEGGNKDPLSGISLDGSQKLTLKTPKNPVGSLVGLAKEPLSVSVARVSAAYVGGKPISVVTPGSTAKTPPLHLVGGSGIKDPLKPPAAPSSMPNGDWDGLRREAEAARMRGEARQKLAEIQKRIAEASVKYPPQIPQFPMSREEREARVAKIVAAMMAPKDVSDTHLPDLEAENRALVRTITRLQMENDDLRKALGK